MAKNNSYVHNVYYDAHAEDPMACLNLHTMHNVMVGKKTLDTIFVAHTVIAESARNCVHKS